MTSKGQHARAPSFKLEVPGGSEVKISLMEKIYKVRAKLKISTNRSMNHADILETVLDHWLDGANQVTPQSHLQVFSN